MGGYLQTLAERSSYPAEFARYDSQYGGVKEWIGWTWYDTVTYISAATTRLAMFNALRALNLSNMQAASQFPSPQGFFLRAIRVQPYIRPFITTMAADGNPQTGSIDDMKTLLETGVLTFTIGQKLYGQWPLWMLPAGGGIVAVTANGDIDVSMQVANNGLQDPRAVYTLSKPIFIAPQINFAVTLDWPAGAVTLDSGNCNICVMLDGDSVRPVQ